MAVPTEDMRTARFAAFEADLRSGELRKDGIKVKLEGQPFQVLAVLLSRPGQLVTRDELRKELWPDETFVDFEQGINAAIKRLRAALEDSAEKPNLIETLPRRGYRFIGRIENGAKPVPLAIEQSGSGVEADQFVSNEAQPIGSAVKRQGTAAWRPILIGLTLVAALVLVVFALNPGGWRDRLLDRPSAGEISSIAVLPLQNLTGDPEQAYFVDGMTEALISELGKIRGLRVISRTSAMSFKDAKKPLPEIARQLSVDAVVEGAVSRKGDQIRISARLIQPAQERVLWSESYERDIRDISALQSEIAFVLADETKGRLLNREQARISPRRPVEPRAYEAFLHGRYLQARRTPQDMRTALAYFQHALEIDPSYAPAYVGIMDCYSIGGGRQMGVSMKEADARMKEAAHKVIELDGGSAAAHYALAMVKWHEWDFPGAEKEFQRGLELNPGDVQVRQHYAHYLIGMRRPTDARREIEHALALDPLSPMLTVDLGFTYLYDHDYAAAARQSEKALAMEKDFMYARNLLAASYWQRGQAQQALTLGWPTPYRPERNREARKVYERLGVAAMLRWILRDVEQHQADGDFYSRDAQVALWYAALNDREKAIASLERALEERDPWLPMDLASPQFDTLRSDPRFQDLLRRYGFPV
jgi:TolB-like protein/DNA-binding winged helix-turn-helix (wHTH) protein/Tfp pilus assembly protein PilF